MRNILIGHYVYRPSPVHGLDPRTKLLGVLLLTSATLAVRHIPGLVGLALFWALVQALSQIPLRYGLRNVRSFAWLLAFTFLAQIAFTEGRIVWSLPGLGLRITSEGIYNGVVYSLRLVVLINYATLLTLTTSPMELADALEHLLRPLERLRVPVRDLVMMISLSLRFIPILLEEAERIRMAQLSRGARFSGSLKARAEGLVPLVLPLFVSAFRRAEDLALAMEARCYYAAAHRTSYKQLRFARPDVWAMAAVWAVVAIALAAPHLARPWL